MQISQPTTTGAITSSSSITTTATATAGTLTATTTVTAQNIVGTVSLTTPALLSDTQSMSFGGDEAFTITRPDHGSGSGTSLTIAGQAAAGSDQDGGNVMLKGGAKSGVGTGVTDGSVVLSDAAGAPIMSFSGTTATVAAGKTLAVNGPLTVAGKRVSTPASNAEIATARVNSETSSYKITAHGDKVSMDREFIVLQCDNSDANMRDVLNPAFMPGTNGQIVHVVNIGEDHCQMQRNGPSQADGSAKFKLINNENRLCLKSTADGGGPITFFYYWANGAGGWQQMTAGPTTCD
jgi:hypothetical protein